MPSPCFINFRGVPMIQEFLDRAKRGEGVWLCDVKAAWRGDESVRRCILALTLTDGTHREFDCPVPHWETEEQRGFVRDCLCACVYNILCACGGRELKIYVPDGECAALAGELPALFALSSPVRRGYGKAVSVSERMTRAFGGAGFSLEILPMADYAPAEKSYVNRISLAKKLRATAEQAEKLCLCGIDVGGTDIKLAVSIGKRLIAVKEYDWNPAGSPTAEGIIEPMLRLLRLMRLCAAAEQLPPEHALHGELARALKKDAPDTLVERTVEKGEALLGERVNVLDGIGVSYPDVVVRNAIVGGETPKTDGMRRNKALDYESEFRKLTELNKRFERLCRRPDSVRMSNDGNIAAYTAAMELAHSDTPDGAEGGVLAHTLGTDLGTGWLRADGTIPEQPLELYDILFDLGSFPQRALDPADLRSVRNENSGLPGARRYMGQAAAYRMAGELRPALLDGFTVEENGLWQMRLAPEDMRKPCLERLMALAEAGDGDAREIFYRIGLHLGKLSREAEELLEPGTRRRCVFGRFVKRPACFRLIREGCAAAFPELELTAADEDMACTALMRELAAMEGVTVAQFGQAVGAIYYAVGGA